MEKLIELIFYGTKYYICLAASLYKLILKKDFCWLCWTEVDIERKFHSIILFPIDHLFLISLIIINFNEFDCPINFNELDWDDVRAI